MSHVITVIPVYNGERYLGPTLESVAAQVRRPDLLVVIDDCSTDGTRELVKRFQADHPELKCELRQNELNQGLLSLWLKQIIVYRFHYCQKFAISNFSFISLLLI